MKIILKQFKETLTIKELQDVLNAQLKAVNLNSAGVNIFFKNYPHDLTTEMPADVEYTNLNTLLFDTDTNKAIVYIQADASDFVKKTDMDELREIIDNLNTELAEHKAEFEAVKRLVTEAQNDITETNTKVNGLSQTLTSRLTELQSGLDEAKAGVKENKEAVAGIDKNQIGANKNSIDGLTTKQTELEGKITATDGKIDALTERVGKLETPTEAGDV